MCPHSGNVLKVFDVVLKSMVVLQNDMKNTTTTLRSLTSRVRSAADTKRVYGDNKQGEQKFGKYSHVCHMLGI